MKALKFVLAVLVLGSSSVTEAQVRTYTSPFGGTCTEDNRRLDRPGFGERLFKRALGISYPRCILVNNVAHVKDLSLGTYQLNHSNDLIVDVTTDAWDPENDRLVYEYKVSGGKIIDYAGAKVRWALTDTPPGSYTIMAGVNDGGGICGTVQIRRIEILECSGCAIRETE